ncbi:GNAT family N-acetyltransferase [Halomonas cupida]|uniref:GNAT family N-acetyltransferase n=1 Tax=Halomonas cupida TaxID=44933 RepID=UPI00190EB4CB|nr:GNAT family N-acetyltransferase [Halomonas cupida]
MAHLWYESWRDAHAAILPEALVRHRTLESFRSRLQSTLSGVRVAGPPGRPLGLCIIKEGGVDQLFVSECARGTGVATALLSDAEASLGNLGVQVAWLVCAIGNERAAGFYRKNGWQRTGNVVIHLPISDGVFPLEVWRYEKVLSETWPVED